MESLLQATEKFRDLKICVVGDIIADIYIFGKPYRLSREAPVVVVKHEEERTFPGSAGNTINNLIALGARVFPLGFLGRDEPGERLARYFAQFESVDREGLIRHDGETVTKTRILAGDRHTSKQQVIRIDKDGRRTPSADERARLMNRLREIAPAMDGFILSDYGHGVVDDGTIAFMRDMAREKVVVGDSRYNLRKLSGITMITPNEAEAYDLCGAGEEGCDIEEAGQRILGAMELESLLITRGNKGMSLFLKSGETHHIPVSGKDDVTDVTGAGDTVCAVATLALAGGADPLTACRAANYAAGVVVMKRGTATVTVEELRGAIAASSE